MGKAAGEMFGGRPGGRAGVSRICPGAGGRAMVRERDEGGPGRVASDEVRWVAASV